MASFDAGRLLLMSLVTKSLVEKDRAPEWVLSAFGRAAQLSVVPSGVGLILRFGVLDRARLVVEDEMIAEVAVAGSDIVWKQVWSKY